PLGQVARRTGISEGETCLIWNLRPARSALSSPASVMINSTGPTPCPGTSVGAKLDHMAGFALAFTAAANHTEPPGGSRPPSASASRLADDWRTVIPARLAELADAWRDEAAWSGMTKAGGQDLPSEI